MPKLTGTRRTHRLADLDERTVSIIRAFITPADQHGHELWTGGFMPGGLPMISIGGVQGLVRPIIAELSGAELPPVGSRTFAVTNRCGMPACVHFGEGHNVLVRYSPKITEAQKEDARRRWVNAGRSLDVDCPTHHSAMRVAYRRARADGERVYVHLHCNACVNERVRERGKAALALRNQLLGKGPRFFRKGFGTGDLATNASAAPVLDGTTVHTRATTYSVSCLPDDPHSDGAWDITVKFRGVWTDFDEPRPVDQQWVVTFRGLWYLSRTGTWDVDPLESEGRADWLAAHRFDLETALRVAAEQAPLVKVSGMTAADLLAWRAEQ